MTTLTLSLVGAGAILPLMVVIWIYQTASWRWRLKPHKIFCLGLILLSAAFVAQIYLSAYSLDTKKFLEHPSPLIPTDTLSVFLAIADSNEILAKLIELVTIPVAVSLIVAALFAKADLSFHEKVKKYEQDCANLYKLKKDIEEKIKEIGQNNEEDIEENLDLKEKRRDLQYLKDEAFDLQLNIEEEFKAFIDAKMVLPLRRKRNRR